MKIEKDEGCARGTGKVTGRLLFIRFYAMLDDLLTLRIFLPFVVFV